MLPQVVTRSLGKGMQGFTNIYEQIGYLPPDLKHDARQAAGICLEICKQEGLISKMPEIDVLETDEVLILKLDDEMVVLSGELNTANAVTV